MLPTHTVSTRSLQAQPCITAGQRLPSPRPAQLIQASTLVPQHRHLNIRGAKRLLHQPEAHQGSAGSASSRQEEIIMGSSEDRKLSSIAVFCGASSGTRPEYTQAARSLGQAMTAEGIKLVYGGGTVGLMGEIARAVNETAGPSAVFGVIPRDLAPREVSGEMIGEVVYVDDMHTRKALMAKRADGFIGMPGGFGTLEELLEVITWQQLGFHAKPIGLLNVQGFYDPLLQFFKHCVDQGFIREQHNNVLVSGNPEELIKMMREFKPPVSAIDMIKMANLSSHAVGVDVSKPSEQQQQ